MASPIFAHPSLADQCLPECGNLSYGKVFEKLSEKCGPLKERLEGGERIYEIESIQMSATNGFTSRVFRCKIIMCHVNNGNGPNYDPAPFSLILKIITMDRANSLIENFLGEEKWGEMLKEMTEMKLAKEGNNQNEIGCKFDEKTMAENLISYSFMSNIHRNECTFYEFINVSVVDEQQCPVPIPKIYFSQLGMTGGETDEPGLIVMEDLQDAYLADFANGFNEEQVFRLTTCLANLHAHILSNSGNNWQKMFKSYDEIFSHDNQQQDSGKWIEAIKEQLKDGCHWEWEKITIDDFTERLAIPLKRLGRMFQGMEFFKWAQKKVEEELGIAEMLVHGDLWVNNILWQNKNKNELAGVIDWQLTQKGNPMMDIARLTAMSTEPELRHELEKDNRLLDHYLKTFNTKLAEKGMEMVKYGVKELEVAYDLAMVGQSICCAMVVPFFERVWAEMPDLDHRLSRLGRRTFVAMADIVEKMEKLAPEWLLPAEMPNEEGQI